MAEPTSQERDLISIFQSRISDLPLGEEQSHEQHLLRWIRAREGDITKAEEMLRRHMDWRKTNGIGPSLLDFQPDPYLTETYRAKFCGYDNSGCPILLFTFGVWDLRPAISRGLKEEVIRYKDQNLEKVMRLMNLYENQRIFYPSTLSKAPAKITQFNCICDWTGFSLRYIMSREAVEVILEAARSFEANYPETLKGAYNVNCPKVFDVLFKLVKPFLSERTLSKIFIYDSNEARWKHDILRDLPIDQVPVRYGGTRDKIWDLHNLNLDLDQDGIFFSQIFPKSRESNKNGHGPCLEDKLPGPGFKSVRVASFDKISIPVSIATPKTTLKWDFKVEEPLDEIDFAILCENGGGGNREVCVDRKQVKSDVGDVKCEKTGNYWVVFSNSSSEEGMDEHKTIFYKLAMEVAD